MMKRYAHVENGVVTNVSNWDGETPFDPGPGITMVLADGESDAQIGATYDGTFHYVEPDPVPDTRPYDEKRKAEYPSIDELTVALWEGVVEERMSAVTALEAVRQAVKTKHPK
jgi:hypothetical protein